MSKLEDKWSCSMCTYDNYQASSKCSLCLHPRGSEVIQLPPVHHEKPLVIKDLQSSSQKDSYPELIICPPSCSRKLDNEVKRTSRGAELVPLAQDDFLIKKYDGHPSDTTLSLTEIANTPVEDKPWPCNVCTFINPPLNAWCSQCNSGKSDSSLKGASASGTSDKHLSAASNDGNSKKWTCSVCTYENWIASKKCVICHTTKGSTDDTNTAASPQTSKSVNNDQLSPTSSPNITVRKRDSNTLNNSKHVLQKSKSDIEITTKTNSRDNKLQLPGFSQVDRQLRTANTRSRSPSSGSHSSSDETQPQGSSQTRSSRQRRAKLDNQPTTSLADACSSQRNTSYSDNANLPRSNSSSHLCSPGRLEIIDNRSFKNRTRNLNWLFLKACIGVVDGNIEAVDAYLAHGGNIARSLTLDEINSLNRPSAFDIGHTLVHLAIRFQRHNILALLLTPEIAPRGFKRNPAHLNPDVADLIRREIMMSLRTRKGDFHCRFLSEYTTFQLPIEICDLPSSIQKLLFNELLDQDVQKELEEESAINWSQSLLRLGDCNNRLYALWNRSAGDCLLDSVLQATWGVFDRDNVLRMAMSESLQDCATSFFKRWRDWELYQASLMGFSLSERQCLQDWGFIHSLAQQPGASLEHCHIFVLSHILRRPIIIYGIKYLKSFRGDTLGFAKFQGVYLPSLWDQSFCYTSPIALGYTRGHFTALVTMENDSKEIRAGPRHRNPFNTVKHLPLVDSDGKILPIHFTAKGEGVDEEQRKEILQEWLDCYVTNDGLLVARQRPGKRPPSVTRLIDGWLDHYRHMSFRRLGEEGDSDDEDE